MGASSGAILVVMNEYLALFGGLPPYPVLNVSTYVWTIPHVNTAINGSYDPELEAPKE